MQTDCASRISARLPLLRSIDAFESDALLILVLLDSGDGVTVADANDFAGKTTSSSVEPQHAKHGGTPNAARMELKAIDGPGCHSCVQTSDITVYL